MSIKIIINGVQGKMGRVTQDYLATQTDFTVVAGTGSRDDLVKTIQQTKADVVIDFTTPQTVFSNVQKIIAVGARPVVGTTGLTIEQIDQLKKQCRGKKLGGVIAPNFSLGAVLMMKYAKEAAQYFPEAEIIEMHHAQKIDAPSGTALKTAQMMAEARVSTASHHEPPSEKRARGERHHGVTIHSIRLPGLFAHQAVIFAGEGQTLTIRHDALDRSAMMAGVLLACRQVMTLDHLVYGLEDILPSRGL